MKFTVKDIAHLIGGKIKGDPDVEIFQLAKIDDQNADTGSICFLSNLKYENFLYSTNASAVIIKDDFAPKKAVKPTLILVKDPYSAFTELLTQYQKLTQQQKVGIQQPSFISPSAKIGKDVFIAPFTAVGENCIIGDNVKIYANTTIGDSVSIGANTIIYAGVHIYNQSIIGENCVLHAGVVIGSDGFGFAPQEDGTYRTIPQLGNVIIGNNVSIGANTTIDRATMGATIIADGVKLDNLIQVGHNVEIGANTVISAQTGISGSTKIGKNCVIGGQVGITNSLKIPDYTRIGAKSGVNKVLKNEGMAIQGYPALEYNKFLKSSVVFRKLPDLQRKIDSLENKLKALESLENLAQQFEELKEKILNLRR